MSMASQRSKNKTNLLQRGLSKLRSYSEMLSAMLSDDEEEENGEPSINGRPSLVRMPSATATPAAALKQLCCAQLTCRKTFSLMEASRTCCMCKKEFCRSCAAYRRRLSTSGDPDPLGELYHVCRSCLEATDSGNHFTNQSSTFRHYRRENSKKKKTSEVAAGGPSSSSSSTQSVKSDAKQVADRLAESFQTASKSGWIAGLVSELIIPDWQKCIQSWHRSADFTSCEGCRASFGFLSRKFNCRICGRVFCTECAKEEIIVYVTEEGGVKWAINGKEGGPSSKPQRFETLPVCKTCCAELQVAIMDRLFAQEDSKQACPSSGTAEFMDGLEGLQRKLMALKNAIEDSLPEFMYLVDVVDNLAVESPSQSSIGRKGNTTHTLAKLQYELTHLFSQLAISSQKLKVLEPRTGTQSRLLQNVTSGIFHYYSENIFLFRSHKQRLAHYMSDDSLMEMRSSINARSMTNVSVLLQQLASEGEGLAEEQQFSSLAWALVREATDCSMQELKASIEKLEPGSWEEHYDKMALLGADNSVKSMLNITAADKRLDPALRSYALIVRALPPLRSCKQCLAATTAKVDFPKTKRALLEVVTLFQTINSHFLFLHVSYEGQFLQKKVQYRPLISIVPMCIGVCEGELKALMSPRSWWERYSSEVDVLKKWWAVHPNPEPSGNDNPYFAPIQFISKKLNRLTECAESFDSCKDDELDSPKTRAVLKNMSESMTIVKSESILCYALFGLRRLIVEYSELQKMCNMDSSVIIPVFQVITMVEKELKEKVGLTHWGVYSKEMMELMSASTHGNQQIEMIRNLPPDKKQTKIFCKYVVVYSSLVVVSDVSSYIETFTAEQEFSNIKSNLRAACAYLDGMKASLRSDLVHE